MKGKLMLENTIFVKNREVKKALAFAMTSRSLALSDHPDVKAHRDDPFQTS